ncbi:hypothetical protein Tco_1560834 [Tanacetum coccineum]
MMFKSILTVDLLREKDSEIANLKAQLYLKEVEAVEAIRLCGQVAAVEAVEGVRVSELDGLKAQNLVLERKKSALNKKVVALESAAVARETEVASLVIQTAKLNKDLSNFQRSFDELSVKAAFLESERGSFVGQVSVLQTTYFGLHDHVSGYELFKEQYEAVQDAQVKLLSDRVAELDSELMGMALHLDEEFYPRFLTTIASWRWILIIGLAIDKGMQTRLVVGIDHGKARRGLTEVAAYDPFVEDSYGPSAETLEASHLQPSHKQILLPIYQKEDNVVIGETFLSFLLDVVHAHVQRIRGDATSRRLFLSDALVPLIEPLSAENYLGEASTSGAPKTVAATTILSTTFAQTDSVPPILV